MTKVYEGDEIITKLQTSFYYESFLAKIIIIEKESESWFKWKPYNALNNNISLFGSVPHEGRLGPQDFKEFLYLNEIYIVSVFNRFHSQHLMPKILMFNFNCTRKQMIEYWEPQQSCWWQDKNDLSYDENGKVIHE